MGMNGSGRRDHQKTRWIKAGKRLGLAQFKSEVSRMDDVPDQKEGARVQRKSTKTLNAPFDMFAEDTVCV